MLPSVHSDTSDSPQSPELPTPNALSSPSLNDKSIAEGFDLSTLPTMSEVAAVPVETPAPVGKTAQSSTPAPVISTSANQTPPGSAFSSPQTSSLEDSLNETSALPSIATNQDFGSGFSLKDEPQALQRPEEKAKAARKAAEAVTEAAKPDKARLPTNLPVDFVDLYDVLSMHRDSNFPALRKRIAEMYLDAQNNLDHRIAKKKLHYQELFEVLLPQARHLLLDPERRSEYDKYLDDHCEDQGHRALAEKVLAHDPRISGTASVQEAAAKARSEEERLTPEQLEERRLALWEKWEENLASAHDPLAQLKFSMPELQARAGERKEYMERALIEVHDSDRRRAEEAARRREAERREAEEAERRAREEQIEARRRQQYTQTVDNLTTTGRLYWGFGVGSAVFVAGFALLFYLDTVFGAPGRKYPLGDADNFRMLMLFFTLISCGFAAWNGTKIGEARIRALVKTPEVARRDADIAAAQIVTEHYQRETSSAKAVLDKYEVDLAIRDEAIQQLRLIRRSTVLAMMKRNAMAGWSFGLGVSTFVLSTLTVFLIDYIGRRGDNSSSRGTFVLFGLFISLALSLTLAFVGKRIARKQRIERNID